jgi:hypothetical protein
LQVIDQTYQQNLTAKANLEKVSYYHLALVEGIVLKKGAQSGSKLKELMK